MSSRARWPADLVVRPMTENDVEAVTALIAACEIDLDGVSDVHTDDVASNFVRYGFDPALDAVVIRDGKDVVAWADLYNERAEADVHPAFRGRGSGAPSSSGRNAGPRSLECPGCARS